MTPRPSLLDRYRRASLPARVLLHIVGMLAAFGFFVGGVSFVAVAGTRAMFPPSDQQALASASAAGEAEDEGAQPKNPPKTKSSTAGARAARTSRTGPAAAGATSNRSQASASSPESNEGASNTPIARAKIRPDTRVPTQE